MCPWKDTLLAGGKVPDDKKVPAATGGGKLKILMHCVIFFKYVL